MSECIQDHQGVCICGDPMRQRIAELEAALQKADEFIEILEDANEGLGNSVSIFAERAKRAEDDAFSLAATQCEDPIPEEHGHMLCGRVLEARNKALEEAAKLAEEMGVVGCRCVYSPCDCFEGGAVIAESIRALKVLYGP